MPTTTEADDALLTTIGLLVEALAGMGVTFNQRLHAAGHPAGQSFEILLRLQRSPEHRLRMSELAAQTTLTASGLTRAVDRLERDGLVARAACPEDRRVSWAQLTTAGQDAMAAALPAHVAHIREVLGTAFDEAELRELGRLARKLRDVANPVAACASDLEQVAPAGVSGRG